MFFQPPETLTPVAGTGLLDWEASKAYVPGSTQVWINGLALEPSLTDGWTELGGKQIRLSEAPQADDVVRMAYRFG